jgi:hypothetical protein
VAHLLLFPQFLTMSPIIKIESPLMVSLLLILLLYELNKLNNMFFHMLVWQATQVAKSAASADLHLHT